MISLPLAPFHALQGVDTGAAAVRDFNQTARRFSTIVGALPAELRGEMQLLLLDADDLRTVRQGVAAFELAAASAERVSLAVDRLPEELRATLDQEVRALLEASEGPVREASHAMAQANELAGPLQETATQLREASAVWRDILGPSDPTPRAPDDRPFDVREWEGTVRTIGASAVELRALATELQGLAGALEGFSAVRGPRPPVLAGGRAARRLLRAPARLPGARGEARAPRVSAGSAVPSRAEVPGHFGR